MWGQWLDFFLNFTNASHVYLESGGGGRRGQRGVNGDGRRLDFGWQAHDTVHGWCVTESYTRNLCTSINQCRLNTLHKFSFKKTLSLVWELSLLKKTTPVFVCLLGSSHWTRLWPCCSWQDWWARPAKGSSQFTNGASRPITGGQNYQDPLHANRGT